MRIDVTVDVDSSGQIVLTYKEPVDDGQKDTNINLIYTDEALLKKVRLDY